MIVPRVNVSPGGVGLPHLHERVTHGASITIDDAAAYDDPFAQWLAVVLVRQVGVLRDHRNTPKHWAGELVKPFRREPDELSSRRSPGGGAVVRIQVRGFAIAV
jgi:hypothetical protein